MRCDSAPLRWIQAIYNESRPIEEVLARMQAYKDSRNPREQVCLVLVRAE
jgi:hypothetical protein